MKSVEFEVGGKAFVVVPPNPAVQDRAERVYQRAYQRAVSTGVPLRKNVLPLIDEMWSADKHARYERLRSELQADEALLTDELAVGGARVVATRLKRTRAELRKLRAEVDAIVERTAEARAGQAMFDFLVAARTYRESGGRCFIDVTDFVTRREQEEPVAVRAHWTLARELLGLREDFDDSLPENVFFRRHGSPAEAA